MSVLTKTNLKEHCRTCLKRLYSGTESKTTECHIDDVQKSKNLHFNISNDPELQDLININVDSSFDSDTFNAAVHNYPENVCIACYNKLYSFAIFRRQAQESAQKLRTVLNCKNIKVEVHFEESGDDVDENMTAGILSQASKFQLHDATAENEETFFETSALTLADAVLNDDTGDPFSPSAQSISDSIGGRDFSEEEENKDEDMNAVEKEVVYRDALKKGIAKPNIVKEVTKSNTRKSKPPKIITKNKYRCPQCNEDFVKNSELTDHVNQVHALGSTPFLCDHCDKSYRNLRTLKEHILDSHQVEIKAQKHFQCTQCPTAFLDETDCKKHIAVHLTGKKTRVCGICGEGFAVKKWLIEHLRTHTSDGRIPCSQCDKTYTTSDGLENHERAVHLKEKPHYCQICDKHLQNKQSFRIHNYRHSGKKPYLCDICGKDFRQRTQMKTHRLTHLKNDMSILL
ncbi:zinc finger protein 182-like [Eurosta solidaginis]|uniref:zinc finger protein 182-like n=1 Tax=Eurosta solidaginis TaxID=178769 RepID=UPI00353166DF